MDTPNEISVGFLRNLADELVSHESKHINEIDPGLKDKAIVLIDCLRAALWPQIFGSDESDMVSPAIEVTSSLEKASRLLYSIISSLDSDRSDVGAAVAEYLSSLPEIKKLLNTDIRAAYEGDPAAASEREIILAYPAFEAISIYRLAHKLYEMEIPLLPRMMTEYAHRLTGIDIHPGATIGSYFFIDHGTGVVIGETTVIGHHVKLYQGVTLGAKSFPLDENGNPIKGLKRHPDIGNNVVIYAGATILGGDTCIGDNAVVGGNVWLTHSIEAGKQIIAAAERLENQ